MTIEINMRLDEGGRRFTEAQFEQRAQTAVAALGQFGTVLHRVRRLGNDQPRHLVAQVHVDDIPASALFKLAEQFNQECLGIFCNDRTVGRLVGPSADRWGPFDLMKFERFNDAQPACLAGNHQHSDFQQYQEVPNE